MVIYRAPSLTFELSDTNLTPGSEFTMTFTIDYSDFNDEKHIIYGFAIDLLFDDGAPFGYVKKNNSYFKYDFIPVNDSVDLETQVSNFNDTYNKNFNGKRTNELRLGCSYKDKDYVLDTTVIKQIILTINCKVNDTILEDDPVDLTFEFGGEYDYYSCIMVDRDEYYFVEDQTGLVLKNWKDDQTKFVSIKDKYSTSNIDNIKVTAGENDWEGKNTIINQTLNVKPNIDEIKLNISTLENASIYSVNPGTGSNGIYKVPLNSAGKDTIVSIKIIAEKATDYVVGSEEYNSYIKEYTFTINRAKYSVATLTDLTFNLSSGVEGNITLDKEFDSEELGYILSLPHGETSLIVKPKLTENVFISGVTCNGVSLNNNVNNTIDISGKSSLEFVVTAQDGTTNTYTVNLNYLSNDVSLKDNLCAMLIKTEGTSEIDLEKTSNTYKGEVSYTDAKGFSVNAEANDSEASISFNPTTKSINFSTGFNEDIKRITITVTSQSGRSATYTVEVKRLKASEDVNFTYIVKGETTNTIYSPEITGNDWHYYLPLSEVRALVSIIGLAETTTATGSAITGVTTLPIGNTRYTLTVTPENTTKAVSYYIYIHNTLDKLNDITNLEILKDEDGTILEGLDFTFESSITSDHRYTKIVLPYSVTSIYIKAAASPSATVYGAGTYTLTAGEEKVISVYAISEYDKKYNPTNYGYKHIITIERERADTNNLLESLSFKIDGVEYINEFNPSIANPISVVIPNTVDTTVITKGILNATLPQNSKATIITDLGEYDLPTPGGVALQISVIVEAESKARRTYKINVSLEAQELSNNANMSEIKVTYGDTNYLEGVSLEDILGYGSSGYPVNIPYNVASVIVSATAESETATVNGGQQSLVLSPGDNKVVSMQVIAQDGTLGEKYYLNIIVGRPNQDAYLTELKFDGVIYEELTNETRNVTLRVNRDKEYINIEASACQYATIDSSNLGVKELVVGRNTYNIIVKAEDTSVTTTVTIVIYRAEDDATILGIELEDIDYTYDASIREIEINVLYNVSSINVLVSTTASYATIYGKGLKQLNVGLNVISVYIESDYYRLNPTEGAKSNVYVFKITRQAADNNTYLSSLEVLINGSVVPFDTEFDKEDQSYIIANVSSSVTSVFVRATPEKMTSTVSPTGTIALNSGTLTSGNTYLITVIVTSESNDTRNYMIYISRESVSLEDNNDIIGITIKGNDSQTYFQTEFDPTILTYEVNVPYLVSSVVVSVQTPALAGSTVYGSDMYQLLEGVEKIIEVYAVSENGNTGSKYQIKVIRQRANGDTTLKSIKINGALIETFSPTKFDYSKFVLYQTSRVDVLAETMASTSTIRITINNVIHSGLGIELTPDSQTIVQIMVIAQNSEIATYTITITRASADGVLESLYIDGVNFHDEEGNTVTYNPEVKTYYATVTYAYSSILICAAPTDATVEVRGIGNMPLVVGRQEFQIAAIPRTGNVTLYTIVVIRKAQSNNKTDVFELDIVEINKFKTDFNNTTDIYENYHVDSNVINLTFNVKFNIGEYEEAPTYQILGNELTFGNNVVLLLITSTDLSTTRTIIIKVHRDDIVVEKVTSSITDFEKDFSNETDVYTYKVSSSVKEVELNLDLKNSTYDSYEISDTKLKNGNNTIKVTLKTGQEVNRVIYLNVYKARSASVGDYFIIVGSVAVLALAFIFLRKKNKRL